MLYFVWNGAIIPCYFESAMLTKNLFLYCCRDPSLTAFAQDDHETLLRMTMKIAKDNINYVSSNHAISHVPTTSFLHVLSRNLIAVLSSPGIPLFRTTEPRTYHLRQEKSLYIFQPGC